MPWTHAQAQLAPQGHLSLPQLALVLVIWVSRDVGATYVREHGWLALVLV